jgi:CRISPR-associated protein Csx10
MIIHLELELVTDVCLSTSNNSLGEADTHDYIPGRTLWGAVANAAYRSGRISAQEAFRLLHQGAVRILDGVPLLEDAQCYPSPLAWHQVKGPVEKPILNFSLANVRSAKGEEQYAQRKVGWLSTGLVSIELKTDYSLRTAVDSAGKAREGLLYGLPVLRAGARFVSAIMGAESDVKLLADFLVGQELRIGRSRNSELGVIKVRRKNNVQALAPGTGTASRISLLCVSRGVFRDPETGMPSYSPTADVFGLPKSWKLELESTFVRTARVVHFNAKRGRPEMERFALEKGSVLTYAGGSPVSLSEIVERTAGGVGEFKGQGYGQILVAPAWLTDGSHTLTKPTPSLPGTTPNKPSDPLFLWATERQQKRSRSIEIHSRAQEIAKEFQRFRIPSSQWGSLRQMARESRFKNDGASTLWKNLFSLGSGYLETGKRGLSSWKEARKPLEDACLQFQADIGIFLELLASASMRPANTDSKIEERSTQ